jgi:hypothetical protein
MFAAAEDTSRTRLVLASAPAPDRRRFNPDLPLLLGPQPGQRAGQRRGSETVRRGAVQDRRHDAGRHKLQFVDLVLGTNWLIRLCA